MFNLKPNKVYNKIMSEEKYIIKNRRMRISIQEYYDPHSLYVNFWKRSDGMFILTKIIHIPLDFQAFYILYIYKHLGKYHPSLRSKFYIGKPRERRE